jgi:hypothetical protein
MKRTLMNLALILLAAVVTGLGVATVTVGVPAQAEQADSYYTMPCYADLRSQHPEVPRAETNPDAYLDWWRNPANAQARDAWLAQVAQCRSNHRAAHGTWDLSALVRISG